MLHTEGNRFADVKQTEFVTVGIDRVKAYLASRWQETINEFSATHKDALVMYVAIRQEGYEICVASSQIQAFYDTNRLYEVRGADFIDIVRAYGRMVIVEDSHNDIRLANAREVILGFGQLIGIPVMDHHQSIEGVFLVMKKEEGLVKNSYVKGIAQLATSIEESIKYLGVEKEIDAIRNVDPLTRLVSRDRMMSIVQLEFERSQRSDIPFSMVLVDIDDFKRINETFGHDTGDKVLMDFSEEIASRIRMVDTACRWDGDAFVVLCPQTDLLGANTLVNDLFSNLTHHIFPNVGRCFFSMGIADYSASDVSINDMLLRLDKALYRVKAFGGNSHQTRYH